MSERRKKRTRKANSPSVRSLQTRQDQPDLQAETEPMPQQEGEAVAETDTENREEQGGKMYGQSFKDRIAEHKGSIIKVVAVIGIAAIISAVMVMQLAVGKDAYTKAMERLEGGITVTGAKVADIENDVDGILAQGPLATRADVANVTSRTEAITQDVGALQTSLGLAQTKILGLEAQLALVTGSPPEGYLTGTFANSTGNYTLHAKCSEAGNFTANINLVYAAPVYVGNATNYDEAIGAFYAGINWTAANTTVYVPTLAYNSTAWGVSKVQFNIDAFALVANNETAIPVLFGGLNATYEPDFVYVDIWPILKG